MKKIKYEQAKVLEDIFGIKWKKIPQVKKIVKIKDGDIIELNLYNNNLTTLPESIGDLKSLEFLSLSNNQ